MQDLLQQHKNPHLSSFFNKAFVWNTIPQN